MKRPVVVLIVALAMVTVGALWTLIKIRQSTEALGVATMTLAQTVAGTAARLHRVDTLLPAGSRVLLGDRIVARLAGRAWIRERRPDDQFDSTAGPRWQTFVALASSNTAGARSLMLDTLYPEFPEDAANGPGLIALFARDEPGVVYFAAHDSTVTPALAGVAGLHGILVPPTPDSIVVIELQTGPVPPNEFRGQLWWPALARFIPVH